MDHHPLADELPAPAEYNRLRAAVGWNTFPDDAVERFLPCSLYGVCARTAGGELLGMVRVVGDGGLAIYIQDLIVVPDWQRCGIGSRLLAHALAWIAAHAQPGAAVGLMSAAGREPFYERHGFTRRPAERLGCGMTLSLH